MLPLHKNTVLSWCVCWTSLNVSVDGNFENGMKRPIQKLININDGAFLLTSNSSKLHLKVLSRVPEKALNMLLIRDS